MPFVTLPTFTSGQAVRASYLTSLKTAIAELRPQLSSLVTVASTASETAVATLTIPANDASAGAVYYINARGVASVTGTPTITFRARFGGLAGAQVAQSGALTASSGITNHSWECDVYLVCITTGTSGTWYAIMDTIQAITVAGAAPFTPSSRQDGGAAITTRSSTQDNDLMVTVQWSASSASNTATCEIADCRRITA